MSSYTRPKNASSRSSRKRRIYWRYWKPSRWLGAIWNRNSCHHRNRNHSHTAIITYHLWLLLAILALTVIALIWTHTSTYWLG